MERWDEILVWMRLNLETTKRQPVPGLENGPDNNSRGANLVYQ